MTTTNNELNTLSPEQAHEMKTYTHRKSWFASLESTIACKLRLDTKFKNACLEAMKNNTDFQECYEKSVDACNVESQTLPEVFADIKILIEGIDTNKNHEYLVYRRKKELVGLYAQYEELYVSICGADNVQQVMANLAEISAMIKSCEETLADLEFCVREGKVSIETNTRKLKQRIDKTNSTYDPLGITVKKMVETGASIPGYELFCDETGWGVRSLPELKS